MLLILCLLLARSEQHVILLLRIDIILLLIWLAAHLAAVSLHFGHMPTYTASFEREFNQSEQLADADAPHPTHRKRIHEKISPIVELRLYCALLEESWLAGQT